jgi:hypothetical protein
VETFTSKISFVRSAFGEITVARDGVNVATKCPKCKSPGKRKFSINLENWSCHCWVCGIKGKTPYRILSQHVGESTAREFSERFLNIKISADVEEIKEKPVELPAGFTPLCLELNSRDPDIRDCISYLKSRGLYERDLWYFKIGSSKIGKFRRRIIIPSFDSEGELNYFSARTIDDSRYKYINSRAKKREIIFNEINIDWKKEITIVEGPFDLFKCNSNSTCLLGSVLSKRSYLFKKIVANQSPVLLGLDLDMKEKTLKIADLLSEYGCEVRILSMGKFNDVGEMSKNDFNDLKEISLKWTRQRSLMEKIASIRTGSLF